MDRATSPVLNALDHAATIHDSHGNIRFQNIHAAAINGDIMAIPYAEQDRWTTGGEHVGGDGAIAKALRTDRITSQILRVIHADTGADTWLSVVCTPIAGPDCSR